jgi:hypothetical protein
MLFFKLKLHHYSTYNPTIMKKIHLQLLFNSLSLKLVMKTLKLMSAYVLLSSILMATSACRSEEELPIIQYVAPELETYFETFSVNALNHGYAYQLNTSYRVICEKIEGLYVGYSNKANHTISINPQYLHLPKHVEFVMMHECGHYFFDMKHGDNFIMADALDTKVVHEYMQNRQLYMDQFFGISNNKENNYISSEKNKINNNNNLKCTF